jgi:hypothetical protein
MMLREMNPVTARRSRGRVSQPEPSTHATCLLCRVLWPIVVQHRHLVFDDVRRQRRPHVQCTSVNPTSDLTLSPRLVFQYSEEISINGSSGRILAG